jgi:hypothetical protein
MHQLAFVYRRLCSSHTSHHWSGRAGVHSRVSFACAATALPKGDTLCADGSSSACTIRKLAIQFDLEWACCECVCGISAPARQRLSGLGMKSCVSKAHTCAPGAQRCDNRISSQPFRTATSSLLDLREHSPQSLTSSASADASRASAHRDPHLRRKSVWCVSTETPSVYTAVCMPSLGWDGAVCEPSRLAGQVPQPSAKGRRSASL